MKHKNLTTIGTSHIAIQSVNQVKNYIQKNQPEIITLELDKKRFPALFQERKFKISDIRKMGIKPFLFNIIGAYVEKKLGKLVGVSPGSEMKIAVTEGLKYKAKIFLIDKDIQLTLKNLFKEITWKEKFKFVKDISTSFFKKKKLPFDLRKVPPKKVINKLLEQLKNSYPSVHKVLIQDRNIYMASKLKVLLKAHPEKNILAIIGAGHEDEIIRIVKRD